MKRTYKSKKGTGGALDHRDVILNADEKSSAFDAFYIQNIKQTKRELSCIGSSKVYGADSKKVRKKKYVKRIVKNVENIQPRESMSTSTYLTPDKSIRVNKVLDPFDMLLNSSSTGLTANMDNKSYVFDQLLPQKKGKKYTRKKMTRVKKINYSSDCSSSSDKENSHNPKSNTTDIRAHELLVEKELKNTMKYSDESINKIFNNLSLINNFKQKTANTSFNTSYKCRNRLMKSCQSPILHKSPLCSTPFKDKYRGKSIYNFSPISTRERPSDNGMAITEEDNESNNSIVFICKQKVPKISKDQTLPSTKMPIENVVIESNSNNKSLIYENEIDPIEDLCETDNFENDLEPNTDSELVSTEQSLLQITENTPFLGFSNDKVTSVSTDKIFLLRCSQEHTLQDDYPDEHENDRNSQENAEQNITLEKKNNESDRAISLVNLAEEYGFNDNENNQSVENSEVNALMNDDSSSNISSNSQDDNESMYDTCNSEQSFSEENVNIKEPTVTIERMSNSVFIKYYEKMLIDVEDSSITDSRLTHKSQSVAYESQSFVDKNQSNVEGDRLNKNKSKSVADESQSLVDESQSFVDENQSNVDGDRFNNNKSQSVADESQSFADESQSFVDEDRFNNNNNQSVADESQSFIDESQSFVDENQSNVDGDRCNNNTSQTDVDKRYSIVDEIQDEGDDNLVQDGIGELDNASFYNCSQYNLSNTSKITESDSVETEPNEIIITDSSITEDIESNDDTCANEDEEYVSFVTTRRRNEIINDSMFIFDKSYSSSSTDCDKTVLSNKDRVSCFEKSDFEQNLSVNKAGPPDNNESDAYCDGQNIKENYRVSRITTRKSSILTRQQKEKLNADSSINEVTIIETQNMNEELSPKHTVNVPEDTRTSVTTRKSSRMFRDSIMTDRSFDTEVKQSIVLQPGKKWERSLSIYRRMTMADHFDQSLLEDEGQRKGRKYRQSVISTMEMQDSPHNESINSRRSTFISKPSRRTIRFVKDSNNSRISLNTTDVFDDLKGE